MEYKISTDTTYKTGGYVGDGKFTKKKKQSTINYLPTANSTDGFANKITITTGVDENYTMKLFPTDVAVINDFSLTSQTAATEYSIGIIDKKNNQYTYTNNAVIKSVGLNIPEDGVLDISLDFISKETVFRSTTDYADGVNIIHAPEETAQVLTNDNVTSVSFNGIPLKISKFNIKIDYDIKEIPVIGSDYTDKIIVDKKITIGDLSLSENPPQTFVDAIQTEQSGDFVAVIGSRTITIPDIVFPEISETYNPKDILLNTFSSNEVGNITIV